MWRGEAWCGVVCCRKSCNFLGINSWTGQGSRSATVQGVAAGGGGQSKSGRKYRPFNWVGMADWPILDKPQGNSIIPYLRRDTGMDW